MLGAESVNVCENVSVLSQFMPFSICFSLPREARVIHNLMPILLIHQQSLTTVSLCRWTPIKVRPCPGPRFGAAACEHKLSPSLLKNSSNHTHNCIPTCRWTPIKVRPCPGPRFGAAACQMPGERENLICMYGGCVDASASFVLSLTRTYAQTDECWMLDLASFRCVCVVCCVSVLYLCMCVKERLFM